jgi:Deoxycytidylate deaminase
LPTSQRPSWDETWLTVAHAVARRSLCVRDRVGAIIVTERNRVVATGYNNPAAGFPHGDLTCDRWCKRATSAQLSLDRDYADCVSLHAEANALSVCERNVRERGTIYVTSEVCWSCAKLIANSGLARVVINTTRENAHRNAERSYDHLADCGIEVSVLRGEWSPNAA